MYMQMMNVSSMTDEDFETDHLRSASLLDETTDKKSVRCPKTIVQKLKELSDAIAQVGRDNLAGTNLLTSSIESVASEMSGTNQNPSEMIKIKSEINTIKSSLSEIMEFLKSRNE